MTTAADWQGRVGVEWAKRQEALDALLEPVGAVGLERLNAKAGETVLDLGCGAGTTTLQIAQTGAHATGVDISPDLLDVAAQRPGAEAVQWRLGDASAIRYGTPFDALYSRCGAMFFAQPMVAFAHLRFQMRPGARLVIVCWRDAEQNEWARLPLEAARSVLSDEATALPQAGGQGPFGWARAETFVDILMGTGWTDLEHEAVDRRARIGARNEADPLEAAVEQCLKVGPLASRLKSVQPSTKARVAEALRAAMSKRLTPDGVKLGTSAWVITARA